MINIVENMSFNPLTDTLCTLDVESLYTNIPQRDSMLVIETVLDKRPRPHALPTNFILQLLEVCLTRNFFLLEDQFFQQVEGTSMGAICAPNLAILYMDALEVNNSLSPRNPFRSGILQWKRYIDDIFMIWQDSDTTLQLFLLWLNNNCGGFTFTLTHDRTSIPFLDLNIFHMDGSLHTSLFHKPTERNTLLRYDSHHPRPLWDSLPYSQFLRIRRNCSMKEDYFREAEILRTKLTSRGYPHRLVLNALKRAWHCPREALLEPKVKPCQIRLVCVTTFSPVSNVIRKIILKN